MWRLSWITLLRHQWKMCRKWREQTGDLFPWKSLFTEWLGNGNGWVRCYRLGAGFREGPSAFSLFDLPEGMLRQARNIISRYSGIEEGVLWPQGDHSIFLQYGVPAIAVSSKWFIDNMDRQDIRHTPKDNPEIVDCRKIVEVSMALNELIRSL